jgi:hypothetical protein
MVKFYFYFISTYFDFSISSSDFPFVSGNFFRINKKPNRQINPYNQNVPLAFRSLFRMGKVYVRTKQAIQSAVVEIAMAVPLMLLGNISERTTHVIGARVIA